MTTIGAIFTSTCHTKQLNPWPNSSASRVVILSRLSACQGKMGPFKDYPSTRGRQTGLRKRPEWKQTVQLSAVVNTYPVGVLIQLTDGDEKCVLKLCVYKTLLANLVTYIYRLYSRLLSIQQQSTCNSANTFEKWPWQWQRVATS